MARVTVEDCLKHVNNRFELVLQAAKRARLIADGKVTPLVAPGNDKPTVIALREIGAGLLASAHAEYAEEEINAERSVELALLQKLSLEIGVLDN